MIHSYYKIKTDKNFNEDFKTYSTIGVLQYLHTQLFWNIIRNSVADNGSMPQSAGRMLKIDFWDKWYDTEGTSNSNHVEPDVFIRFENFDCIIEVKKEDSHGQYEKQWTNQKTAYKNKYGEGKLIYIALGGNSNLDTSSREGVYKSTWQRLLYEIDNALKERNSIEYKTDTIDKEIIILQSVVDAFACYNEYVVEFLDKLKQYNYAIKQPPKELFDQLWKEV